jgi:hypothetical protein
MAMTEAEWLACTNPMMLLEFLQDKAGDRKLRLFACGCYRHVWDRLPSDFIQEAVEITERLVDGLAADYELDSVSRRAMEEKRVMPPSGRVWMSHVTTPLADCRWMGGWEVGRHVAWETSGLGVRREERRFQAALLRCVVANPFRPPPPLPPAVLAWNDSTVRRIAEGIYEERELPAGTLGNPRLAILADALLDAGCEDEELIRHCRSSGPHVRGCWAVDLILGKS